MSSAVRSGARGGSITIAAQGIKVLILMTGVVILSRLLEPSDFGLVAMVTVIVAFGELLRDLGLSTAALRAPTLTKQQASNLFWANTLLGAVGTLMMSAAAPVLVAIYGEPRLALLTPILAVSLLINGVQAQFQVQLARARRFFWLNATDVIAQFVALIVAIVAALNGLGYWALVMQPLTAAVLLFIGRVVTARWMPSRPRKDGETLPLVRAGVDYSATQVLSFAASNVDTVMIGSVWGASSLGQYNRAFQLYSLPVARLLAPLVSVVLPVMNAARAAGENIHGHYLRLQSLVGLAAAAMFCVSVAAADPLVTIILGPNWDDAILLFQILAIGGIAQGLSQVSFWIFLTEGQSRALLKYNLVTKTMTIVLVVCGALISLEAAAAALSLSLLISWPINILWLGRTAGLPWRRFLANGARIYLTGALAAVATLSIPLSALEIAPILIALLKIVTAGGLFIGCVAAVPAGRRDLAQARAMIKRIWH